jgi:hypothetical protein
MTPAAAAAEMKLAGAQKAARIVPVVSPAVEKPAALATSPATAAPLAHQHALDDEPHQLKTECRIFEEDLKQLLVADRPELHVCLADGGAGALVLRCEHADLAQESTGAEDHAECYVSQGSARLR